MSIFNIHEGRKGIKDKCTEVSRTKDHFLVSEPNHELIKKLRMSALSLSSPALAASGQSSAKLPVIQSSGHQVNRSSSHPVICSSGHLVVRSFDHLVIRSSGHSVILVNLIFVSTLLW